MHPNTLSPQVQAQLLLPIEEQFIDHILEFDPLDPATALESASLQPSFLIPQEVPAIPWENVSATWKPHPAPLNAPPVGNKALPQADFLIVTWTVAEALALSDVFTPAYRSSTDWYKYQHNWLTRFKPMVHGMAPSLKSDCLGKWFMSEVGNQKILCFKSELHMAKDGKQLPVKELWKQLIREVRPKLVITTGTAGGIGPNLQLGDVVISQKVRFDCKRLFGQADFKSQEFTCTTPIKKGQVALVNKHLMAFTKLQLPLSQRAALLIDEALPGIRPIDVVTTDFFAFDDDNNDYELQGLGAMVEMGDATLALACQEISDAAPPWVCIRNASDPQIVGGQTLDEKRDKAGRIYEKYGYWTTINSAIGCWAVITSYIE